MKIANIITTDKVSVSHDFNIVNRVQDINPNLPSLIIGYNTVSKSYLNYDITNRILDNGIFWTFRKTERRDQHEEDLYNFINYSYNNLISKIRYIFVDPIQLSRRELYAIINVLKDSKDIVTHKSKTMYYLYTNNVIYGIDLKLLKYIGFNINNIENKIINVTKIFLTENISPLNSFNYSNYISRLDNQVKYVPYLFSLFNSK